MFLKSLLWRIPLLLLLGTLLVACTTQTPGTQPTPTPPAVATTPPTPIQPAVTPTEASTNPTCQTDQLTLAYITSQGLLANRADEFSLQNTSTTTCTLTGYPQIQLLLANYQPTTTHETQLPSGYLFPGTLLVKTLSLPPGEKAYFVISWVAGTCAQSATTAGAYVQVTPPEDAGSLTTSVRGDLDRGIDACGQITVSPVAATTILPSA